MTVDLSSKKKFIGHLFLDSQDSKQTPSRIFFGQYVHEPNFNRQIEMIKPIKHLVPLNVKKDEIKILNIDKRCIYVFPFTNCSALTH